MCEYEVLNVQQQKKIIIFYSKITPLPDTGPPSPSSSRSRRSLHLKKEIFFLKTFGGH